MDARSVIADYLVFERRRTARRQYLKAFGGMAVIVLVGALFGRVPERQAEIAAGLLLLPPAVMGAVEAILWRKLVRRLDRLRADVRIERKS